MFEIKHFEVLVLERMFRTVEHMQVLEELAAKTVLGEHTLDNTHVERVHTGFEVLVERFLQQDFGGELTLATGIACVGVINAVCPFLAGENHFVGVDDDHIVAALHERRITGFVFAAENFCDFRADAAEHQVGGIDQHPLLGAMLGIGGDGFVT